MLAYIYTIHGSYGDKIPPLNSSTWLEEHESHMVQKLVSTVPDAIGAASTASPSRTCDRNSPSVHSGWRPPGQRLINPPL